MSAELLPTGRPFTLQLGEVRAEVGSIAGVLRSLTVDGVAITQPTPSHDAPAFYNGIVLSPWPNRVRGGRWKLGGALQQLDITEPLQLDGLDGNSLHGLLPFTDYELVDQTDAAITLAATIYPQHGWPFLLDTWIRYELVPDGLTATHGVTNRSAERAPYATGAHPYLRVGDTPIGSLELTVPASAYFEVDEQLTPIAQRAVDGTVYDIRAARRVSELALDTAFGGLEPANVTSGPDGASRGDVAWLTAPDGARVTLWQDTDWRFVQVFTTGEFPSHALPVPGSPIDAIGIEPMTAPPDALNSGEGLIWLEPGQSWQGSWGLRYSKALDGE